MDLRCENCGQVVLPTDTVCWQCGWKLPVRAASGQAALEMTDDTRPISITAVFAYASLTLLTILLLFIVFKALGAYPVVVLDPQAPIKPGWQLITDQRQTFTLELPPGWAWAEDDLNNRLAERFAADPLMAAALGPWLAAVGDLDVRLIANPAVGDDTDGIPGFVLVSRSDRLAQLAPDQMAAFWSSRVASEDLLSVAVLADLRGQAKGTAVLAVQAAGEQWICRQEVVGAGGDGRFLVAGCAPADVYEDHAREYEILLSSFQLLLPPS